MSEDMSERERLARILHDADCLCGRAADIAHYLVNADAALAAGYSNVAPRPELNAGDVADAETPTTVEWGVRIGTAGHDNLHKSEASARAEVDFWAEWEDPNPSATQFPRSLIIRTAAGTWMVTQ